jgi:amidase
VPSPPAEPDTIRVRDLGCAFYTAGGPTPVAAPIQDGVRRAARALADAGLRVDERTPPGLESAHSTFLTLATADGGAGFRLLAGERFGEYRAQLRALIESVRDVPTSEFLLAGMARDFFRVGLAAFMEEYPLLLGPVLPIPAFRHDHDGHDIEGTHVDHLDPLWGTDWVNLAGLPAVAIPAGLTPEGLPIDVQVVGRRFAESEVLAAAAVIERALGGWQRPPID